MKSRRRSVKGRKGHQGRGTQRGALDPREAFRGTFQRQFRHIQSRDLLFLVELLIAWESNPYLLPFQGLDAHREGFHPLYQEGRHHDLPLPVTHLS